MIGASKKLLQATAGNAGGPGLDVTEVFSTYLYAGNGATTNTITNGIDLDGEGGLVWVKRRDASGDHNLTDTERGTGNVLNTAGTGGSANFLTYNVKAFNSNGFSVGSHPTQSASINYSGDDYVSWTFRKAPKFFDVVTYTGNGVGFPGPQISHNLQARPGWIVIKRTDSTGTWDVAAMHGPGHQFGDNIYYRFNTGTPFGFDNSNASAGVSGLYPTYVSDTYFMPNLIGQNANVSGATYVAYVFAHNDGDGEFGPSGDQDIIKCGSYTGTGTAGNSVDLGFEPQWILLKNADASGSWAMYDTMRGWTVGGSGDARLFANSSGAESLGDAFHPTATGFEWDTGNSTWNNSGNTFIYIAIRRGPLAPPEDEEDLFYAQVWSPNGTNPQSVTVAGNKNFIPDFLLVKPRNTANNWIAASRLTGGEYLNTNTDADGTDTVINWGVKTHYGNLELGSPLNISSYGQNTSYAWSRSPGFFDAVTYTGDGTSDQTIAHNLGVPPQLLIVKNRARNGRSWPVTVENHGSSAVYLSLNTTSQDSGGDTNQNGYIGNSDANVFHALGSYKANSNLSGDQYIAYLFASLDGISKVGSYTGNGSSQTINAGFTTGSRFVLIKRTDTTGDWYVWDHRFGINAGTESHFSLNTNAIKSTADDSVDPASSGFIVNQISATNINVSSATYIFYAIA